MLSYFDYYYKDYKGSMEGFKKFHNEVINMPRDKFSSTGIDKIKHLAGYLLLTEEKLCNYGTTYKIILKTISNEILKGNYPKIRDISLEERYFKYNDINSLYDKQGRMFRHLMSLCNFFDFFNTLSRQRKTINYDKCKEYYLSSDKVLMPIARNNLMMLNIGTNSFIKSLKGIDITVETDYRPTYAILKYIEKINRPVTKFELSILLGRIDSCKKENEILERAFKIGLILPPDESSQIKFFFDHMEWKHIDGSYYQYARSQEPHFKFNTYLLFMETFNLLDWLNITKKYSLTDYSIELLQDDISYLIVDLEKLINIVDDYENDNRELNDLIIYQRNPELLRLAKEDDKFIKKMNIRSINQPHISQKDGERKRNRLIAELAKIKANYKCQYEDKHMFKTRSGKYYCEAHHVLEFSEENGPDITNNLVVLGPNAHMTIHHGCKDEVDNVYLTLIRNKTLTYKRIEEMVTEYNCLDMEQIDILNERKVITNMESEKLKRLINDN